MSEGASDNVVVFPAPEDLPPEALPDALIALLFAAGEPVTALALAEAIAHVTVDEVAAALGLLASRSTGALRVVQVAGAWQLRTDGRFAAAIRRLRGGRPAKMSRAALEALAIVAYRQPVTRAEIDGLRGVNSGGVLKQLLDKSYLRVLGRRDEPGRPLEYGTTALFLEMFELRSLAELPTLEERDALTEAEVALPASLARLVRDAAQEE